MEDPDFEMQEDSSHHLKVKPLCKPDAHLKKTRHRIFNENSIELLYSFGLQPTFGSNLNLLKENIVILIAGNYLNFLNIDTMSEHFLPSLFEAGFCCVAVHPSTLFFAAAEKGPKFCINVFSYPALEAFKHLKYESSVMPTCIMQFHPQGDLLVSVTSDPENKVLIWLWELELMFYVSDESSLPVYSLHFSAKDPDTFITSGKGHITFWNVIATRDDRDVISEVQVTQQDELLTEFSKVDILCTVSVGETFLSATGEGFLLLWNSSSLTFDDAIRITMPGKRPCHEGSIHHILTFKNFFMTVSSDGCVKFWDFNDIVKTLHPENGNAQDDENEADSNAVDSSISDDDIIENLCITPVKNIKITNSSSLVYGIVSHIGYDTTVILIQIIQLKSENFYVQISTLPDILFNPHQDNNGSLFQVDISDDFLSIQVTSLLSGLGLSLVDFSLCPVYPLVATVSKFGTAVIYDCVAKEVFMSDVFPVPITCMLWPSLKGEMFASSFLVGFQNGTLQWLSFKSGKSKFCLKFILKPHTKAIQNLKMNDTGSLLVSQGSDLKLFFYSVEKFSLTPLGFYINHHDVIDFVWLKYASSSISEEYKETLLIICRYSYLIETSIPDIKTCRNSELRKTYYIENKQCQVYKINGLREHHKLGDRIYDSDCEEQSDMNEAEKDVLRKLKYEEKKESRENRRHDLGLSGPLTPPEILCFLPSLEFNHIWLSLGKEDFGYIFEFKFEGEFLEEPLELIPVNALEILTAETVPVLSMQYSPCGKFIFMGLEDGSINICFLEQAFMPASGYDFAKYQIHDSDLGAIKHLGISPEGSFIVTAGGDGNVFLFHFNLLDYQNVEEYGVKPSSVCGDEAESISPESLDIENSLKKELNEKYHSLKEQRMSALECLKEEYMSLNKEYTDYLQTSQSLLSQGSSVFEVLKLDLEKFSAPAVATDMFLKDTRKYKKEITVQLFKLFIKSSLLYEKYFKFFKSSLYDERVPLKYDSEENVQFTFRGCKTPITIENMYLSTYPKMCHAREDDKILNDVKSEKEKVNDKILKLEHELSIACKAIIDYPSDTPVSELILKYNQRKEKHIQVLKEHIEEQNAFEKISPSEEKYNSTHQEIQDSLIKFKDSSKTDISEYASTYAEKKVKTALYYKKISGYWNCFNSLAFTAFKNDPKMLIKGDMLEKKNKKIVTNSSLMRIIKHIYYKKGVLSEGKFHTIVVKWNSGEEREISIFNQREKDTSKIEENSFHKNFISILTMTKSMLNCEKKFHDLRFCLKCIELNVFKNDLKEEKKWLKIIKELEDLLSEEHAELSALEEKMCILKNKRQLEKNQWMNVYNQFQKAIGLKHRHKGYFKQVFKKKIRSDDEKQPQKRHASSESSDSEPNIDSDDDIRNIDPKLVDPEMLREVLRFRLKRHEVEQRMKNFKRNLMADSAKVLALQRRIQKVKDALSEAQNELNSIPANRKINWQSLNWPVVLYPANVHMEFIDKLDASLDKQKAVIHTEMSAVYDAIRKDLKEINKFIRHLMLVVTDNVVHAEINDLIDVACVLYPVTDYISHKVDEYFKTSSSINSADDEKEEREAEKKPINFIQEILLSLDKKDDTSSIYLEPKIDLKKSGSSINADIKVELKQDQSVVKVESNLTNLQNLESSLEKTREFISAKKEYIEESVYFESTEDFSSFEEEKNVFKSWKDVKDTELTSKEIAGRDFDIETTALHKVPTLDSFLIENEHHISGEDYYMQSSPVDVLKIDMNKYENEFAGLEFDDYVKMLLDLDVAETVEDLLNILEEKEPYLSEEKIFVDSFFPMHPGGGLVLTKSVLISMEKEDSDSFPYTNFYQEIIPQEKLIEKPKLVHMSPHIEEEKCQFDITPVSLDDFIVLDINEILKALNSYCNLKTTTMEFVHQFSNLEKKVLKARNRRINIEQELIAAQREKLNEMKNKFNGPVNLDLLQDVIDNPHLRIKKYESEKKIDVLKKDLKKAKASEVAALKSLDKFGFEDTKMCHELLLLRRQFKLLKGSYSSKVQVISKISKGPNVEDKM